MTPITLRCELCNRTLSLCACGRVLRSCLTPPTLLEMRFLNSDPSGPAVAISVRQDVTHFTDAGRSFV